VTIASSRLVQLGALTGAVLVGACVYYFVGGLAGGLYAAAALVFGLFAHFRMSSSAEKAPKSSEPHWNRWGRKRAQLEDLQQELDAERALVTERDTHVEVLRRELEEQRQIARSLEGHYLHELAALEEAHQAEADRISAGLRELEEELAGFELVVDDLVQRATPQPPLVAEASYEGAGFQQF
jgi:signal transduction histidine kinase